METSDIYFAGYLIVTGCPVTSHTKRFDELRRKEKTFFIFEIEEAVYNERRDEYFNGGQASIVDYNAALRNLKARCFM